jgi:hypothetical protein
MQQAPQLLTALQHLLVLQVSAPGTLQHEQQQAWELLGQAFQCSDLLQVWGTSGVVLPQWQQQEPQQEQQEEELKKEDQQQQQQQQQQQEEGEEEEETGEGEEEQQQQQQQPSLTCWLVRQAANAADPPTQKAAAGVVQLLLTGMPLSSVVSQLFAVREAPGLLLRMQQRLDLLEDTSLLEGVAALLQRCTVEEFLPVAAAVYGAWVRLYTAARRVQPQAVAAAIRALHTASSGMPALLAGLHMAGGGSVRRLTTMLRDRWRDNRQQLLSTPELPGAITTALSLMTSHLLHNEKGHLMEALLRRRELVCSSPELQEAVVAWLRGNGESMFHCPGYSSYGQPERWPPILEVSGPLPVCHALLIQLMTVLGQQSGTPARACIVAADQGLVAGSLALQ